MFILIYSRSLLIDSCILSILFWRFLIIFTILILNSFSNSLPTSSSFIWTSVFLVCYFICAVFLCLFITFLNLLCLRSPSPRLQGWILSSFWKKGWCSGLCKLLIEWDLSWVFFLWWARLSEVVILSADDWVCIFVLFVVWMRLLHRVLLVVGWCWVLYLSGFLCVSSHYLMLPRVSSLVV